MNTWDSFLAKLREDIQDTSTDKPRWSSKLLWLYTCDAIRDYSAYFPMRIDRVVLELANDKYTLPSDFLEALAVENPSDRFLTPRQETPGRRYVNRPASKATLYYVEGLYLYLNGLADGDVLLTYYATHPVPTSESNTTFEFTVPDRDEELLRIYVRAQVYTQMRAKTSRLDRFDQGSGRRDDNPLTPETKNLMDDYYRKVAERLPVNFVSLYRVGKRR